MIFVKTNMSKYKKNVSVKKDEMRISIITKKKSRNALNTKKYDKVWAPSMFKFERQSIGWEIRTFLLGSDSQHKYIFDSLGVWGSITDLVQHSCLNSISFHNILSHRPARPTRPASPLYFSSKDTPRKQISEVSLLLTTSEFRVKLSWRLGFISSKLW